MFDSIGNSSSDSSLLEGLRQQLVETRQQLAQESVENARITRELKLRNAALDVGTTHFMILDARLAGRPIVYVNRALANAHGYLPAEMIGRSGADFIDPASFDAKAAMAMEQALAAGQHFRAEVRALRRDGSTFSSGFTTQALRDESGAITHMVMVAADITLRLEAERKREELQAQLVSGMQERERMSIELRLAQKLESVGRLAAGLAHEINTPIQYVSDSIYFLRSGVDDLLRLLDHCRDALTNAASRDATQALVELRRIEQDMDYEYVRAEFPRAFERTREGTERVSSLVRAMKDFAHPDANEHAPADLNHAIQTTLIVCRSEYKYLAELTTQFDTLPTITCNIGELNQVFLNLIVNAAHGIQDAGRNAEGKIHISTRVVDSSVEVVVADNGCGIAAEHLEKIFDPFFTTKEIGRGTGQGLAIARAIVVDKHRGDIRVTSEVGVGTTFTILLPIGASVLAVA